MAKQLAPSVAAQVDRLAPLGEVRVRSMFGGHGIFEGGVMFALVADDALYFKADADCQAAFEAAGSDPFVYLAKGRPVQMSYWRCPAEAEHNADVLLRYAGIALDAARRARADSGTRKPKRPAGVRRR